MKKHKQGSNFVQMHLLARYTLEDGESFILIFILLKLCGRPGVAQMNKSLEFFDK